MRKFVIGDIHGAHKALVQVLERCGFNYEKDMLITLGDVVDGWDDSFLVVEELLKIKHRIDIVGNHDDWFYTFINTSVHPYGWQQGGEATAESYANGAGIVFKAHEMVDTYFRKSLLVNLNTMDIPKSHKDFFNKQIPFYKDDDNNVFVHGGFNRHDEMEFWLRETSIWDRKLWQSALSAHSGKNKLKIVEEVNKVFLGHTSTTFWGSLEPMKADVIWNLDTGGGWEGKVTIMNVDTEEYWQSDLVTELYPNSKHGRK